MKYFLTLQAILVINLGLANNKDTIEQKTLQVVPIPNIGASPETGFFYGGNVTGLFKLRKSDSVSRTSNANIEVLKTQLNQIYLGIEHNLFLNSEKYMMRGTNELFEFELNYYGIGPDADNQFEAFTFKQLLLDNNFFLKMKGKSYFGIGYRYHFWKTQKYIQNGFLEQDNVLGFKNSISSGITLTYLLDSRDNIVNTYEGSLISASITANSRWLGGSFNHPAANLEVAHFLPTFTKRHVLALHGVGSFNFQQVPFSEYNMLGGENIKRGFYNGRFRDKQFVAAQLEYRIPLYKRVGLVAFSSIGGVAPKLNSFSFSNMQIAGGGGLRYTLSKKERFNFRIDYGLSSESGFLYIGVGEAF